jgi:diaminopimelate epimerase
MEIVVADPAKNITIFVLDEVRDQEKRIEITENLLQDRRFRAEQVGFVLPPVPGRRDLFRLEMTGGEFCGNAARSFGLYAARETGLKGRVSVCVEISGAAKPLPVTVDMDEGTAEVEIPRPAAVDYVEVSGTADKRKFENRRFPLVIFDGIIHVIAGDLKGGEETFFLIKAEAEKRARALPGTKGKNCLDAVGVMFFDTKRRFMTPAVYVAATDTLVFESSCGSGSAALAVWETIRAGDGPIRDGMRRFEVEQPGGIIRAAVRHENGEITGVYIGGPVNLSEKISLSEKTPPLPPG